jgi:3-deoxy-alpha-D-manno-octulosonate 8-oxidase
MENLHTGIRNAKNVSRYIFGQGAIKELGQILSNQRDAVTGSVIFLVDEYFEGHTSCLGSLPRKSKDQLIYVPTAEEPTTEFINKLYRHVSGEGSASHCAVVGIGGGITLDTAKAISNLLTNGGLAEDYQGWDLVKVPGVYKIGIPTLSGTGAEATRTCVMTNKDTSMKMGMNSDFTVFDQLILDPDLTATVPRDQYFYTGMDTWIHCVEALNGSYRNPIGDAFSTEAINLCRQIFDSNDIMSDPNRGKMMVASYLGGCAVATSYVGVVHPFSAGLSVVLGLHHCVANCVAMNALEEFYPSEFLEFKSIVEKLGIDLPSGVCSNLLESQYQDLYKATIVHDKPLTNALDVDFREILTEVRVRRIFEKM